MNRKVAMVRREIADQYETVWKGTEMGDILARWLLALAPNRPRRRPKDQARAARRVTEKELDALCREVVFLRDKGQCRKCGRPAVDWSHCYSRRYKWLRWDLDNSWASCKECHLNWHHRPLEGAEWWRSELWKFDGEAYKSLILRAGRPRKVDRGFVLAYLKREREQYAIGR